MTDLQRAAPQFLSGQAHRLLQYIEQNTQMILGDINEMVFALDAEIQAVFKILKDSYFKRFPELDSVNLSPVEYAQLVLKFDRTEDLSSVDLKGVLSQRIVIVLSTTAAFTTGKPLSVQEYENVLNVANMIFEMNGTRIKMLEYIEGQMAGIAPNVTAIVGSAIASQLVGLAGGVKQLAVIPSGNIQVLGNARKELAGLSFASTGLHTGVITESDLVQNTAPQWRKQALRLVSGKVSLAARIDAQPDKKAGAIGREYRLEIVRKLEKLAEAAPGTLEKTIPPPPMEAKKRRGGKRARRQKELIVLTQARKLQNRVAFGEAETEVVIGSSVMGMGMLSKSNASALRMAPADNRGREAIKKAAQKKTTGFFSNEAPPSSASAPATQTGSKVETGAPSKYFGNSSSFRK